MMTMDMTHCGGFDDFDDANNGDDDYKSYSDDDFAGEPPLEPTPCGGFYQCPNGTVCEYVFIVIIDIVIIIISASITLIMITIVMSRPYWEGPQWGITSFDNVGQAMLTVFQVFNDV